MNTENTDEERVDRHCATRHDPGDTDGLASAGKGNGQFPVAISHLPICGGRVLPFAYLPTCLFACLYGSCQNMSAIRTYWTGVTSLGLETTRR